MKNRMLCFVFALLLCMSFLPAVAFAAEGTKLPGEGVEGSPCLIGALDELNEMTEQAGIESQEMKEAVITAGNWDDLYDAIYGKAVTAESMEISDVENVRTIKLLADFKHTAESVNQSLQTSSKEIILDLNGHTIDRNLSESIRSGYVISATKNLTINDSSATKTGKITGGNNTGNGGGLFISTANTSVIMNAGTITGNHANYGGGVYVHYNAAFIMNGGTIESNTVSKSGGGLYKNTTANFRIGGSAVISGNTANGVTCNTAFVFKDATYMIGIGDGTNGASAPSEGMHVGVSVPDDTLPRRFTSNGQSGDVNYFTADKSPDQSVRYNPRGYLEILPKDSRAITVNPAEHGAVSANYDFAQATAEIRITVTPEVGYQLKADSLKAAYTASDKTEYCELTLQKDGTYKFTMPDADITISAEFEEIAYPVWVSGTQVTGGNMGDVLGDADGAATTVIFDPETNTLTLNGATIAADGEASGFGAFGESSYSSIIGIKSELSGLTIKLIGTENQIGKNNENKTDTTDFSVDGGICSNGDVTFTGSGTLTIYDYCDGVEAKNVTFDETFCGTLKVFDYGNEELPLPPCAISATADVTINGGTFILTNYTTNGIYAEGKATIKDASVTINAEECGICAEGGVTIENAAVDSHAVKGPGILSDGTIAISGDSEVTVSSDTYTEGAIHAGNGISITITGGWVKAKGTSCAIFGEGTDATALTIGTAPQALEIKNAKWLQLGDVPVSIPEETTEFGIEVESNKYSGVLVAESADVEDGFVVIQPKAPVYSGGGAASYAVTVNESVNGAVSADKTAASSGSTVTLTAVPEKGWTPETITVTDKNGKEIEIKNLGDNQFSFRMPGSAVTVDATFMEDNTMLNFCVDVKASDYYYDAVLWAYLNGITDGVDNVHFGPDATVTRAQVVTFLWRAAGCPVVDYAMNMSDVATDAYYAEAVRWALSEGITEGTSATTFSPNKTCTRAEIVTFLWRYAGKPVLDYYMNMDDVTSGAYYGEAVRWALAEGITQGTSATTFGPEDVCTRAKAVTFLYRFSGHPEKPVAPVVKVAQPVFEPGEEIEPVVGTSIASAAPVASGVGKTVGLYSPTSDRPLLASTNPADPWDEYVK